MDSSLAIDRPKRWDHPFDPAMRESDLEWLMSLDRFAEMDQSRFASSATLKDILRNDSKINRYEAGDVIVREGDYGSSAFIVLRGKVRVIISRLDPQALGRLEKKKPSLWNAFRDSIKSWPIPEARSVARTKNKSDWSTSVRHSEDSPRVFVQDINAVLEGHTSSPMGAGELFGEMAAITRSPSSYTVIAESSVVLLEIRWQGLRLLRRDPSFQQQLDRRYREASLTTHLRETALLRYVPPDDLEKIADATELHSVGDMEWFSQYRNTKSLDIREQIASELVIAEEGSPANWLILIRSGFARLSHRLGAGHRTLSYLGRGQIYGLSELVHNALFGATDETLLPYQESLRSIGFVDVLKVPRQTFIEHALPFIRKEELPAPLHYPRYDSGGPVVQSHTVDIETGLAEEDLDPDLLEFLVDQRLINGKQTMLIDTQRCTRCDDCVTACSKTHHGNPRFVRNGPQFNSFQFAHACMHCVDPVCMIGCPTGAIGRDIESGVVSINPNSCIGCKTCSESCPYENIVMVQINDQKGRKLIDKNTELPILQATKCDLCQHLPTGPACQTACPHEALVRIDLSDLKSLNRWIQRDAA